MPLMVRLVAIALAVTVLGGCAQQNTAPSTRSRLRVVLPKYYKQTIRELMSSGVRDFSLKFEDIDWEVMPSYTGKDHVFAPSLAARFADQDPDADVLFIDLYRIGEYRPEWLTPVDDTSYQDVLTVFRPAFLQAAYLSDDKVYAVPWSAKGNFLFYRKDLVPEPPKSWDDIRKICQALPEKGLSRKTRYCVLFTWESIENDLYPLLWSVTSGKDSNIATENVVTMLRELSAMLGEKITSSFQMMPSARNLHAVGQKIHQRFAQGEAIFMINWNNRYSFMKNDWAKMKRPPLNVGIMPIPPFKGETDAWSNIGTWGWIVPRVPENSSEKSRQRHNLATTFVREISSREAVEWLVSKEKIIPARRDVSLPKELVGVLDSQIVDALESDLASGWVRFRDRGSDEFVHTFWRDALHDVLMCRSLIARQRSGVIRGSCARYYFECEESGAKEEVDCLTRAIRLRMQSAQQKIDALGGTVSQ